MCVFVGWFSYELFMLLIQAPVSSENEAVYHVLKDILELINARVHRSLVPDGTLLAPTILRWLLNFWKICAPPC
jgi:hypothetical protein